MGNAGERKNGRLADDRPSLTARAIAQARARLARPSSPNGDPTVGPRLAKELGRPLPITRLASFISYVRGRTKFFDDRVLEATNIGSQIVLVGAGYDDRAFRFRSPGSQFIEVDHPATQAMKRRRLEGLGTSDADVKFLAVDLQVDDLNGKLSPHLSPERPTLILCESVLPYLSRDAAQQLMRSLSQVPGSTVQLAADVPVIPRSLRGRLTFLAFRITGALAREPLLTTLAPDDVPRFLQESGWKEERRVTGSDLNMPASRSEWLFVTATPN